MRYVVLALLSACSGCDGPKFSVEQLQDPETCKDCHRQHYDEWSGSMHAYAAEDPVFVAMNKRGQKDTNGELGDFCISCHAPMAVQLGIQTGANFDPATLPPEAKGITCFFCHNVEQVTDDHNAPIVLAMDQTMRGGVRDPVDNPAHHSKYDGELMASRTNKSTMCGSCHDLVTPKGVHLERSFAEWKETVFATNDAAAFLPQTCSNCHMRPDPNTEVIADKPGLDVKSRKDSFHEHMWPAVDLALTPFPQIDEQKAGVIRDLVPAAAIVGPRPLGSTEAYGGVCLGPMPVLAVRIDNLNAGHMFPSGAAQDRRMWLHVVVTNASGTIIFEHGKLAPGVDPEETTDPALNCMPEATITGITRCASFYDRTFKSDGSPAHFFWEVDSYKSHLIRPTVTLDPNMVGYDHSTTVQFDVPPNIVTNADRIEAQLYIRPLPFAMLRDLEQSGDLAPSVRATLEAMPDLKVGRKSIWTKATAGTGLAINTGCNPE